MPPRGAPRKSAIPPRRPLLPVLDASSSASGVSSAPPTRRLQAPPASIPPKSVAPRNCSPVYWQARQSTLLFAGPLGEVVGEVEEGTVILEHHRYEDPFSGWWMSTHATENGELVWVSYNDSQCFPLREQPSDGAWQRVYDPRATPEAKWPAAHRPSTIEIQSNQPNYHPLQQVSVNVLKTFLDNYVAGTSEIQLIDYFWRSVHPLTPTAEELAEHWNCRYQSLVERAWFHMHGVSSEAATDAAVLLETCLQDFRSYVEELAVIVVEDTLLPAAERHLTSHPKHMNVFYHGNVCVIICCDSADGVYGGHHNAQKVATNIFHSYQYAALEAPKHFLCVPLMSMVDFQGQKLLVFAIPPINDTNCLYSQLRHSQKFVSTAEFVTQTLGSLGANLHLKPHKLNDASSVFEGTESTLPVEVEVYAGHDRRLYLLGLSRAIPCCPVLNKPLPSFQAAIPLPSDTITTSVPVLEEQMPIMDHHSRENLRRLLMYRFRPELVARCPDPINVDVGIGDVASPEDISCLCEMMDSIKDELITQVAGMLGFLMPVDCPLPPTVTCSICKHSVDNELRFVVCRSKQRCCRICPNCYTRRLSEGMTVVQNQADLPLKARKQLRDVVCFDDAVQCDSSAREATALELEPSLTVLMHANGLNMRYLSFVFYRIPRQSRFAMEHYCAVEMVARAAAVILQLRLRGAATAEDARLTVHRFLKEFLSTGAEAHRFWTKELGPQIERSFNGVNSRFDTSALSIELLLNRLQALTGVYLTDESFHSLVRLNTCEEHFIEVSRILPRVKVYAPLWLEVFTLEAARKYLDSMIERVLLFWIGTKLPEPDERVQPHYLCPHAPALT